MINPVQFSDAEAVVNIRQATVSGSIIVLVTSEGTFFADNAPFVRAMDRQLKDRGEAGIILAGHNVDLSRLAGATMAIRTDNLGIVETAELM